MTTTPPIPPAVPGEMAMNAAREIASWLGDVLLSDQEKAAAIIDKHFAALAERADKAERDCIDEIQNRDRAQGVADNLSSVILGEDIDWPDHGAKWEEAGYAITPASEVDQLRADLASANAALAECKVRELESDNQKRADTQELARLDKQLAEARRDGERVLAFAGKILSEHREHIADVGGDIVEEAAIQFGLLDSKKVTESCCESCRCADYGFPADCYNYTTLGQAALDAARKPETIVFPPSPPVPITEEMMKQMIGRAKREPNK